MFDESFQNEALFTRRLVVIGGFLGAGKTTLIGRFARWIEALELKVGLVTNDQGKGLMDTDSALLAGSSGGVEEITGGCFCCRLDELVSAVERLDAKARPDVIVAEPVGSCTDLIATVILPLEQVFGMPFVPSPFSVVFDARRALASLGGRRNARDFHRDVGYVFRKQMEEAEWLVVNKTDLLSAEEREDLEARLSLAYPGKRVFWVSGKTGKGLEEWFTELIGQRSAPEDLMAMDYERYANGEAMLGWVNSQAICTVTAGGHSGAGIDWGAWLVEVGGRIAGGLEAAGHEVGHFKMSVETGDRRWRLHQVISGEVPEMHEEEIAGSMGQNGRLLVNLRAEGQAVELEAIVDEAFGSQKRVAVEFLDRAAFQPGKPKPTHRVTSLAAGRRQIPPSDLAIDVIRFLH